METEYGGMQLPGYNKFIADQLEIMYVKSNLMKFKIFLNGGEEEDVALQITWIEGLLDPYYFFRPHKSFLVNMIFIETFRRNNKGFDLVLFDRTVIPLAKRKDRKDEFFKRLPFFSHIIIPEGLRLRARS